MQQSLHIIYRKTIASLLLVLLIFVYAEKVFHTHHTEGNNAQQKGISIVTVIKGCSICDFKIAKDTELPVPHDATLFFVFLLTDYTSAASSYHYLPASFLSNRGPPYI